MRIGIMLRHIEQNEGGVKVYTKNVLSQLLALPTEHRYVLIYQSAKSVSAYSKFPNVESISIPIPGTVLWDQVAVPFAVWRKRLDLVFNPKITVPLFTRAKTIYVVHGAEKFAIPEHFRRFDRWYFRRLMPIYCKHAAAVIAVANSVKIEVVKHLHADPAKVFAIHNGFDPVTFRPVRDAAHLQQVKERYQLPERFILWAGQIESRKNVSRLVQAFGLLQEKIPHTLVLAGAQRWNASAELSAIAELGLENRIQFPGWIAHEDLAAVYSLADLFVFPSLHEGFGIPLLEAMACGCPIVAANTGSVPEVVNGSAYLVDPLNVGSIAAGIQTVLLDDKLRADLIERGLLRAKDFSWEKTARQLLAVFDSMSSAKRIDA
jgi:glycosyltransferase involved in cell wall biosynthesis